MIKRLTMSFYVVYPQGWRQCLLVVPCWLCGLVQIVDRNLVSRNKKVKRWFK